MKTIVETANNRFVLNLRDIPNGVLAEAESGTIYYRMPHNGEYLVFNSVVGKDRIMWDCKTFNCKVRLFTGKITLEV